jgi:uncharacterized protein (DUF305 family)
MIQNRATLLSAAVAILFGVVTVLSAEEPVLATDPHAGHSTTDATDIPATTAFKAASAQMHASMNIPYTGNPDVDFIAGMIPHHQGAVDTARIVLQHGTDPEVRKFAQSVIDAQEAEIAWMTDWLSRQGQ